MNCSACMLMAEFICSCQSLLLCPNHLTLHLSETGHNSFEFLNISLSNSESEELKAEVITKIAILQTSKKNITTFSKSMTKLLKNSTKSALTRINNQIQLYLKLLSLKKLSTSLKIEADKAVSSILVIQELPMELTSTIENMYVDNFVSFMTRNEVEEIKRREDQKKQDEEEKVRKQDQCKLQAEENRQVEIKRKQELDHKSEHKSLQNSPEESKTIQEVGSNEWTLEHKKKHFDSLGLTFPKTFNGVSVRDNIQEINYSADEKFIFICKIHSDHKVSWKDSACLDIFNIKTKKSEWYGWDDNRNQRQEAQGWFKKYPECFYKWAGFKN